MADVYGWQSYIYNKSKEYYTNNKGLTKNWNIASSRVGGMAKTFSKNSSNEKSNTPKRINSALAFLKNAIDIERSKEANFLIMLQEGPVATLFGEERQKQINDYVRRGNWKKFITEFQSKIGEQRTQKDALNAKIQMMDGKVKSLKQYQKQNNELLTPTKLNNFLKNSLKPGELTKVLNDAIIDAINNKKIRDLRTIEDPDEMLKEIQTVAFGALIRWAQAEKELVASNFTRETLSKYMKNTASIETLSKDVSQIDQEIEELKNLLPILKKRKLENHERLSADEYWIFKNGDKQLQKLEDTRDLLNNINFNSEFTKALGLLEVRLSSENQYGISEIQDALVAVAADTCAAAIQLGPEGAKPDVLVGHIQITTSNAAKQATTDIYQQYNKTMVNFLQQYKEGMGKENTYEYYQRRAKTMRAALRNASELNDTNNINNWFVIEESTKSYDKIQAGENSSFGGGSLGPTLNDQLTKISTIITALEGKGGIEQTMNDFGWFLANTINDELIASPYKSSLLLYLSTFVTIFLFDDQVLIWEDALKKQFNTNNFPTENHRLHLFSLNQDYYPLSFILQAVYERLSREFGGKNINESLANAGARVTIEGTPNLNLPGDFYTPIAKDIIADIKLSVEFLNNFQGLIQALYNQ